MTSNKPSRERLLAHCGEPGEDDGVDPREFAKISRPRGRRDRKTLQLCSQVAETLALVLAGELEDELLRTLRVESVDPAPDASQLAVTLRITLPHDALQERQLQEGRIQERLVQERLVQERLVQERLAKIAGHLRSEVAAAITRKRAPKLLFHLIGTEG